MNRHLHAGWKTARVGLALGVFSIFSEGFGVVVFGDAPEWTETLIVTVGMPLLLGIGGVLYGIILPAFARRRTASIWASTFAGIAAGVATMALFASPIIVTPLLQAVPIPFGAVAIMLGVGVWVGALGGILATKMHRTEPAAAHPGDA